jgi:hypothetical protein
MPLPILADTYKLALFQSTPGPELINTFYVFATGTIAQTVGDTAVAILSADPYWRNEQATSLSYDRIETTALDGVSLSTISTFAPGVNGGESAEPAPLNVAGIITWRTLLRGRRHRGRSYIPCLPVSLVEDNGQLWNPTLTSVMQGHVNDFLAAFAAESLSLQVVSTVGDTGIDIANGLFRNYIGSRRDRLTPRTA